MQDAVCFSVLVEQRNGPIEQLAVVAMRPRLESRLHPQKIVVQYPIGGLVLQEHGCEISPIEMTDTTSLTDIYVPTPKSSSKTKVTAKEKRTASKRVLAFSTSPFLIEPLTSTTKAPGRMC